jgi:elongation factor G
MRIGPAEPGAGLVFESSIRGGVIPAEFISGVRTGVETAMQRGVLAGFPIADAHVRLLDGTTHPNDSSELAFQIAARRCFLEAAELASPYLLEPVVRLEVTAPADQLGAVLGDLAARRAKVTELVELGSSRVVRARAPLSELFGYAGTLRSSTSGRGTFHMELDTYQAVPRPIAQRVLQTQPA